MARVIAFTVELNGIQSAVTNGDSLAAAIKRTNQEFKNADFGSAKYDRLQTQLGSLKKIQADQRAEVRKAAREYEIAADAGEGSYRAINAQLVNFRATYKDLTREQRENEEVGGRLLKQINQLDSELKDIDKTMGLHQRNVGDYGKAFEGLNDVFKQLGGFDFNTLLAGGVAGVAVAAGQAAIQATQYVKGLVDEMRVLRGEVGQLTGSTGAELDEFTARIQGIAETFNVPFQQVLESSNALTEQLTGDFTQSLDLLETGFISGANASDELLQNVAEYSTFFAEAELSGDALINTISQQVRQGIFSDKGVDAIKEATIRLREMPQATKDALAKIGLDSENIRKAIADKGIGAAIQQVSERLATFEGDSQEAGQALADIFGGAGEDAGFAFVTSLATIEDSTDALISKSDEYAQQQARTLEVNQEFARVQAELAEQLGGASLSFDNLGTVIQTKFLQFISFGVERLGAFWTAMQPIRDALTRLAQAFGFVSDSGETTGRGLKALEGILKAQEFVWNVVGQTIGLVIDSLALFVDGIVEALQWLGVLDEDSAAAAKSTGDLSEAQKNATEQAKKQAEANQDSTDKIKDNTKATKENADTARNSIAALREHIEQLKSQRDNAQLGSKRFKDLTKELKEAEAALKKYTETSTKAVVTDKLAGDSIAQLRQNLADLKKESESIGVASAKQKGLLSDILKAEEALAEAEEFRQKLRLALTGGRETLAPFELLPTNLGPVTEQANNETSQQDIERRKLLDIEAARARNEDAKVFAAERQIIELNAAQEAAKARLALDELTGNERLELQQEIADREAEINKAKVDRIAAQEKELAEKIQAISEELLGALGEAINLGSQASEARYTQELTAVESRYEREIELAEGNEARQEELEQQLDEKRQEIEKREFERQKKFRRAAALAALAEGIVNILSTPSTIPEPFTAPFKAVRVGILTATTAQQIAKINAQKAEKGTLVNGELRGATHADKSGGILMDVLGNMVLAEHGEMMAVDEHGNRVIINKRSANVFGRQIKAMEGVSFPGKQSVLSDINSYKNYGVKFAQEGGIFTPDVESMITPRRGGGGSTGNSGPIEIGERSMQAMAALTAEAVGIAAESGIVKGSDKVNRTAEREARKDERAGLTA